MGSNLVLFFFSCNNLPVVYNAFLKILAKSLFKDVSWELLLGIYLAQPKTSSIQGISAQIQKMPVMSWLYFLLERIISYSTDKSVPILDMFYQTGC